MKYARKEKEPAETIKEIKGILHRLNLDTVESHYINYMDYWHSVRLDIKGIEGVGVNGKGISKELAYASAYGELMERIRFIIMIIRSQSCIA